MKKHFFGLGTVLFLIVTVCAMQFDTIVLNYRVPYIFVSAVTIVCSVFGLWAFENQEAKTSSINIESYKSRIFYFGAFCCGLMITIVMVVLNLQH